jgi:hypothetical protein
MTDAINDPRLNEQRLTIMQGLNRMALIESLVSLISYTDHTPPDSWEELAEDWLISRGFLEEMGESS